MSLSAEILQGTLQGVEKRLAAGAPVNILDEYGYTPLIHAAVTNRYDVAALLLKNNAQTDLIDITGSTALHWAVDNNNIEMCKLLLQYGANPNAYSANGQPPLFYPLVRKNRELIDLLLKHGANFEFAKDFVESKLVGHRFELQGHSDVVTPEGLFLSMDLEGFYIELTLSIIRESLERFINSYVARRMNIHENELHQIINSFINASKLREFKHISKDIDTNKDVIVTLIKSDLLLLPVSYKGHAITFIKHGGFLGKCDRGVNKMTDPIVIHTIGKPEKLNEDFYLHLLYDRHTEREMKVEIYQSLGFKPTCQIANQTSSHR
jgi:hypothetical protein